MHMALIGVAIARAYEADSLKEFLIRHGRRWLWRCAHSWSVRRFHAGDDLGMLHAGRPRILDNESA